MRKRKRFPEEIGGRRSGRQWFHLMALALVFILGAASVIGSTIPPPTTPSMRQDHEKFMALKERREKLREQHSQVQTQYMKELDKAGKDTKKSRAAEKEVNRIEAELEKVEAEIRRLDRKLSLGTSEPACFPADMQVITAEGPRSIRDIRVGDRVLTVDEAGRQGFNPVVKTFADGNNHYYLVNGKIRVTALHRFSTEAGWKKARELEKGDQIRTADGTLEGVVSVDLFDQDLEVYNLTVAENHNFFVSPDGERGYLVHNTGGGGGK